MRSRIRNAVLLTAALIAATSASGQPPNIVLVLSDDQGWNDVGFNGAEFYETPHLDRLAREGIIFTNAYSGGPNCAPTRASLISGMYVPRHRIYTPGGKSKTDPRRMRLWVPVQQRYLERHGVTDPPADPFEVREALMPRVESIAEVLKRGGYKTARFGKWQVGPDRQGFEISTSDGKPGTERNHYNDPDVTFELTDAAVEFVRRNRDRPFFLFLSHWDVHAPRVAREELVAKYEKKLASWTTNTNPYDSL